jgi:cell division protein FtsA
MSKTAYVLDIGTTKTTFLAATMEGVDLKVLSAGAVATRGVKKGRFVDPAQVGECVKAAVARVREETGTVSDQIVVAVPGPTVRSEHSRGVRPMYPPGKAIHQEDLLQVNEHSRQLRLPEGHEVLQALPCEYRIDGRTVVGEPLGQPATRLEVVTHIMSALKQDLDRLRGIAKFTGANIDEFVPVALASGLGTLRPSEAISGCLVVDLGGGTTTAAVFERGSCSALASIDVNGSHITGDIAALIKVSQEDAEALKIAHGHAAPSQIGEDEVVHVKQVGNDQPRPFPRKVLSEIIESRVREIATLLREELLKADKQRRLPETLLLTGGGSHLPGADAVFNKVFGTATVKQGTPRLVGPNSRRVALPEMSAAVGLALFALEADVEDLAPVSGVVDWKDKIRSLKSIFGARA